MSSLTRTIGSVAAAAVFVLAACGGDDDSATSPDDTSADAPVDKGADGDTDPGDSGDDGDLAIEDFEFVLQPVTAGAEVTFANRDSAPHTLTADDGSFDTGSVSGGDSTTFTAPGAGDYSIVCTIHPDITGTLTVEE